MYSAPCIRYLFLSDQCRFGSGRCCLSLNNVSMLYQVYFRMLTAGLLLLFAQIANAAFFVKAEFHYRHWVGHGATMYYYIEDLEQLQNFIESVDTLSERNILTGIGLPLVPFGGLDSCEKFDLKIYPDKLFPRRGQKVIRFSNSNVELNILIIKTDVSICKFRLQGRLWGYDVYFKEAGIIASQPVYKKNTKKDLLKLNRIKTSLSRWSDLPVI